jgi:hypothetical protein
MVLAEAAWSSGASGIACEAVIAARPRSRPKTETASNFMTVLFLQKFAVIRLFRDRTEW